MKLSVFSKDGKESGNNVELLDSVFGVEPNETVIYEDVRRLMANKRQGTASTKERGEVRGGGRKAYRQKGTGMARRGSIRSPLLKGGGTVFGPRPRTYTVKMTKKMRQAARKSALSLKAADEQIKVIEDFSFDEPKTADFFRILQALGIADKKVLFVTGETDSVLYKSSRNIPNVDLVEADKPTTYDILNADVLVFQHSAVVKLQESLEPKSEEAA